MLDNKVCFDMDDDTASGRYVQRGTVKWFDPAKGFGFVVADQGGPDILLHANVLRNFGQSSVADRAGIEIVVLDDAVYLGSANFDMRSLYINLELVLKVDDAALADRMRDFISWHIEASERISIPLHKQRATIWNRIRWNLSWLLVSVIDYTVTRRLNLGI